MIQYEQLRLELLEKKDSLESLYEALGVERLKEEVAKLEEMSAQDGFWDNVEESQKIVQKTSGLKNKVEAYEKLKSDYEDTLVMIELSDAEEDLELFDECRESVDAIEKELEKQTLGTLLTGEYDNKNSILTFHAGAGGTEAQDWNSMLVRMYTRWGESHGYKVTMVDFLDGDEAGLKSATLLIEGENAYGFLKSESGVHRLVRISPFDSSGRRHTSFASLEVMPEIDDTIEVEISPEDIKMDVYRASGAGGQKVNKTSSAVRITHIPTGIIVACQDERSQHKNREAAMKMLRSRLYDKMEQERNASIAADRKSQVGTGDRSERIRTYNFPQGRMTDHRIGLTLYKLEQIMNGDLDETIDALITTDQSEKLKAQAE